MPKASKELRAQRETVLAEITALADTAESEQRELTDEETAKRDTLTADAEALEAKAVKAERREADAKEAERRERREKAAAARRETGEANQSAKVTEKRTYQDGNPAYSYLHDMAIVGFGAPVMGGRFYQAQERLQAHARENHVEATLIDEKPVGHRTSIEAYFLRQMMEAKNVRTENQGSRWSYRALSTTTGAGGEFTPPMYLTDQWIKFLRAARIVADQCNKIPLPDGTMSINLPKVVTGTSVGSQGSQNQNVSMTDLSSQFVTLPVVTKAGQQIVSLQLLERSPIAFDALVMDDMVRAYAQAVDVAVLNGAGAGSNDVVGILNTSGINTVTWTQASPTLPGFLGRVGLAKANIETPLARPATHVFVTPNRWEWARQQNDTLNRPLIVPSYEGPFNAVAQTSGSEVAEGALGVKFSELDAYKDANIPANLGGGSNQDAVLVARMVENWLYESPIVTRVLPQTYGAQLSILMQIYGYIAFTAARYPNANSVITGTGLVAPTFAS